LVEGQRQSAVDRVTGEVHRLVIATANEGVRALDEARCEIEKSIQAGHGAVAQASRQLSGVGMSS
jgi:hypothetical protein